MWVVLWTDGLLYVLLVALTVFIVVAARTPHLREPWRRVFSRPMGAGALVILAAFLAVAVLDSIHFRPPVVNDSGEVVRYGASIVSVLDTLAAPLARHDEKTYSAPFATHLYVKELVTRADGSEAQIYPRLEYGGAHLDNPAQQLLTDILQRALIGAGWGLLGALVLAALVVTGRAMAGRRAPATIAREMLRGHSVIAWRAILVSAAALLVFSGIAMSLAAAYHILGTDKIGQDVFYKTLKSIRTGVLIGTLTTLVMLPFALLLGPMAGYFRGWVDDLVQYVYTTLSSIPGVLLIVAAVLMLQVYMQNHADMFTTAAARADLRLLFLCMILGITSWASLCRVLRAETLKLAEMEYVQAAVTLGVGHFRILRRHVLPNVMHIVLIQIVLDFSALVLAEAVLSYIGVGVDPSMNSWGNMINSARLEMARDPIVWWPLAAAFIFMLALVLAANLFADAVRDAFDPRLRRGFAL